MSGTGSSIVDEDTARAVNSGRETVGAMLSTAQDHLRKAFVVFLLGFLGCFYALRLWIWPMLKEMTRGAMPPDLAEEVLIVAVTPFDVILLQAKIGAIFGIIVTIPVLLYYGRDSLREREWYPELPTSPWKIAALGVLAALLLAGGVSYGYNVYFPLMFRFLAGNAISAGFSTHYSIVKWTEFIFFVTLSFGLAAELPLVMSGLSYTGVVSYETFRDKWRYAILGIFVFGAVASPPDPFTQIMWAVPLIVLYGFSLYLAKVVVTLKRGSERLSFAGVVRDNWIRMLGVPVLAFLLARLFFTRVGFAYVNETVPSKYAIPAVEELVGLPREQSVLVASGVVALVALVGAFLYYLAGTLDEVAGTYDAPAGGAPGQIGIEDLDAGGVRAAPPEVFVEMGEDEAVGYARQAMDDDEPEKAQAVLDRWDELHPEDEEDEAAEQAEAAAAGEAAAEAATTGSDAEEQTVVENGGSANVFESTAAGMANAFTEDETTEEDIGGWYYDIRFIVESLTSKMFWLVGIFMAVLAITFVALYQGGIGYIWDDFLSRLPAEVAGEEARAAIDIVTLHPVEALIFEVKISTLFGVLAVLPPLLYWSWPAMKERGLAHGDRTVFGIWAGTLTLGLLVGSAIGYAFVAPNVISWLVADALRAEMIISYRVSNFFWLVFFTTAGIGLLADIPLTMWLFRWAGIVSFETMLDRWREVTIAIFAVAGLLTPDSLYTMFLVAIPLSLSYLFGLAVLWVVTLGGRR